MPGPIVHLIVQQRLSEYLREFGGDAGMEYANLLDDDPCSPFAGFGSMGPDFFFFSLKEYGTPLDEFVNLIFEVYDAFEPLITFYEDNIEPVITKIEDAVAALDEVLFNGLIGQIGDTADLLGATALSAAAVALTKSVDLYYPFYPKIQQGAPESDWYWIDTLHYRRTGRFASTMWDLAGSDDLRRYVLGYASHIGTDVIGHSFVNTIVGGPYRTHWHRHKLVENWIDAYARRFYRDSNRTVDCLNIGSKDIYRPTAISGSYYSRLIEFPSGRLPEPLAQLISDAMNATFSGVDHPVFLSPADIDSSYRLFLSWFERATSIGDAQEPTPVPPPGSATIALISDYVSGFPSFSGGAGGGGGSFSVFNLFAAIAAFVKWLTEVIAYTVSWILTNVTNIFLLPYTEALALVKWLLYQIQKGIWEIYDNLRFALVLGGYVFPEPRDLDKSPWGQAFINPASVSLTGGPPANFFVYPRKQENHGLGGPMEHHLLYPGVLQELPHAEPSPFPFATANPEAFISQGYSYDPTIEKLYDCIGPYGGDDRFTHFIDSTTWTTAQLGSALPFSARLISQRLRDLPNFNLDSDRGYAWKTWRARDPEDIEDINPVEVDYLDP